MPDFQIIEDSDYHPVATNSPLLGSYDFRLENVYLSAGATLYYRVERDGAFVTGFLPANGTTPYYGRDTTEFEKIHLYVKPDPDFSGAGLLLEYQTDAFDRRYNTHYYRDYSFTFDATPVADAPSGLSLSKSIVDEGGGVLELAVLTGIDPDSHPALTYTLMDDPTFGALSITYDRLMAMNGLDYEALDQTGLFQKDGAGSLLLDTVIRVTDPDGNFADFQRTIAVADVVEGDPTDISGTGGDDVLQGTTLGDSIRGGDGQDNLIGYAGNDTLKGQAGDDVLIGNQDQDLIFGADGLDFIRAGSGDDKAYGGGGDDTIFGGQGDDSLFGGDGRDMLFDGQGKDRLHGGSGADIFRLVRDAKRDVIEDFDDGSDFLVIGGVSGLAELSFAQRSASAVSITAGGDELIVKAVTGGLLVSDFGTEDFLFV